MSSGLSNRLAREFIRLLPYLVIPGLIVAAGYLALQQRLEEVEIVRAKLIQDVQRQDARIRELRGLEEAQQQLALRGALIEALRKDGDEATSLLKRLQETAVGNFRLKRIGYGRLDSVRDWPPSRERRLILEVEEISDQGINKLQRALQESFELEPSSRTSLVERRARLIYSLSRVSE